MSDCQNKNNDGVDAKAAKKSYWRWADHNLRNRHDCRNTFGLRLVGMRQGNALLSSMSLSWFMSLPV